MKKILLASAFLAALSSEAVMAVETREVTVDFVSTAYPRVQLMVRGSDGNGSSSNPGKYTYQAVMGPTFYFSSQYLATPLSCRSPDINIEDPNKKYNFTVKIEKGPDGKCVINYQEN